MSLEFINACANGHLEVAKSLVDNFSSTLNVSAQDDYAFRDACLNGHFEVAKWLVHINPSVNVSACDNYAFRYACLNGHLKVAKWLIAIKPSIDISAVNNHAFKMVCICGRLEVAKWLVQIRPYHYVLELNQSQTRILSWKIRPIRDVKWLERAVPVLAYNSKTPNVFQRLNYDTVRYICEFV